MTMRKGFRLALALLLPVWPTQRLYAQAAPNANSPKAAQDTSATDYSKEPYIFELIETKARFEADGTSQRDLTIRVRIQSESAVRDLGLLTYRFASSFESLNVEYVRVRKPDGSVVETPASDVQELDSAVSREAPMYSDQREKHIAVKALGVGDVLEARLRWTEHDAIAPGRFWFEDFYFKEGICLKEIIQLDVPRSANAKLSYTGPKPKVEDTGDRRVYVFENAHLAKTPDSKIPDWEKNFYGIDPPDIQISSFASWDDMGSWFAGLQEGKAAVTPEIRAKAEELTKGATNEEGKIRALYDFVSLKFRYIGVDLGIGRYAAHAAADILANRYGDCKDKHTLLAALLKAEGITAYPALISSRFKTDEKFPTAALFDHVITAIPRGDSYLFLDTTPEVAPYGMLLAALRGRLALVVGEGHATKLVKTPADPPFRTYVTMKIDSAIDTEGTLDATMRLEERGDDEFLLRNAFRGTPQNRWEDLTQLMVARMGFAGKVSEVSVANPEDTTKPFSISFKYHRPEFPDWKNHQITLPMPYFLLPELTDEQKAAKNPMPLGSPGEVTYETTVKLPKDYSAVLPGNISQKHEYAEFSAQYALVNRGTVHGTVSFKTVQREVAGDKRKEYAELTKSVGEVYSRFIPVISPSGDVPASMANNMALFGNLMTNPEAAIPELEKRAAEDPENQGIAMMLAQAYLKAGRAKDAAALVEKQIAKSPDDLTLRLPLGEAYLSAGEIDKAMEQFNKGLQEDPPAMELNTVAYLLAEAKVKLSEAESFSKRSVESISRSTIDIGADDADHADFQLMLQLAASWDTLGWIKFQAGDAESAEKYVKASWALAQKAEVGEHLVEVYEREGKLEMAALVALSASAAYGDAKATAKLKQETERLSKHLPQKPIDGAVELSTMRTVHVAFHPKLEGKVESANVVIVIDSEKKPADVAFKTGNEELRKGSAALASSKYPQIFPDSTPVKILREGIFTCSPYSKDCLLTLMSAGDAAVGEN